MDIKPILSALGRHRIAATLIALEIALACAVLCNACFLVAGRLDLMRTDSGVDERALATVALRDCDGCGNADVNARALQALRAIPGVRAAGAANATPFGQPSGNAGISLDRDGKQFGGVVHVYTLGPGASDAFGLKPAQGRAFTAADYQDAGSFLPSDSQVWVTRALAEHLWPGQDPLGQQFWMADYHFQVAGIVERFARPDPGRSEGGVAAAQWSVIVPVSNAADLPLYVVRADPLDLPRIAGLAREAVARALPEAILDQQQSQTLETLRERYFRQDRAMAALLVAVVAAMLLVTALGIVGLASFWVQQRTRQIGVRRALGATRRDILRYFQTENFLIVGAGVLLGMLLAYAGNLLLMRHFDLGRLPASYLPIGAALLWLVGQLAVLGPALRASRVPPAVATRAA
jgi:putative ABC transport system permease protein